MEKKNKKKERIPASLLFVNHPQMAMVDFPVFFLSWNASRR